MDQTKEKTDQKKEKVIPKPEDYFIFPRTDKNAFVYCRVSTTNQDINKQFDEISKYCKDIKIYPPLTNVYYDNGVSGAVCWLERSIKTVYELIPKTGILIVPELSRMGRDCFEAMELLSVLLRKGVSIHDVKNNLVLNENKKIDEVLKVIFLTAFSEMEKNMNNIRVKSSMQDNKVKEKRAKRIKHNKLDKHLETIKQRLNDNVGICKIAKELNVNKSQVYKYCREKNLVEKNSSS